MRRAENERGAESPSAGRRTVALALAGLCGAALALVAAPQAGAASRRVTFYFGLQRPEAAARAAFYAVSDPASPSYRQFLTRGQAASRYGATPATRRAFVRAARRHGLAAAVDPSGVFARVSGTVAVFERVLGVRLRRVFNNDVFANAWVVAGKRGPRLPKDLRPPVRQVVASYSRSTRPRGLRAAAPPANEGTWTGGCPTAQATGAYSFAQVRHAYGLDEVASGAGASAAILNVGEGMTPRDIAEAAACFGLPALQTRTLLTDGQARPFGRGTFEPQEDLALLRGMAPGLTSVTFVQVWLAPELWFLGAARVLSLAAPPDVFSISYGECERDVRGRGSSAATRAGASLLDSLLVRVGLIGVSTFASAGDFGSTCNGRPFPGVAWPASSPFLTAVGGTRLVLDRGNDRSGEVVWNDLEWLPADNGGGAGGGGLAGASARPPYQSGLATPGTRRAVPDVAAHASILPGWPVVLAGNWVVDSGTSASAPLVAGGFAALAAREQAAGRGPLGPVNGLLYALRASTPASFFDVVAGANGYDPRVPAWSAAPGYDLASGLGVPQFDRVASALAGARAFAGPPARG